MAPRAALADAIETAGRLDPFSLSLVAPRLVEHLDALETEQLEPLATEAARRAERWRPVLRAACDAAGTAGRPAAGARASARLLAEIGAPEDLPRLAAIPSTTRRRGRAAAGAPADGGAQPDALLVRRLARRLARPVFVEDLGVVRIHVGDGPRPIARVRRKVLALVCFLLARPDLAATRDEILDALWESSDPGAAANSLNQTIYYLRRTLEDRYDSRRSPHYVTYDRELVSLDPELVDSRSRRCLVLLDRCEREADGADPEIDRLADLYQDRFALDFAYEAWTEAHRESVHLRYLGVMERAVRRCAVAGERARGIRLARRVLAVDPTATEIELALIRLYRADEAHASVAEQYAHYRTLLRDELGLEAPPLDSL
jgi:DNA-binding SARP family transcriptional activator